MTSFRAALFLVAAAPLLAFAIEAPNLKGEVIDIKNVDSYTYLQLKTTDGKVWTAVPTTSVKKGAQVTVSKPVLMQNFESRTLKTKFDKIWFGYLADPSKPQAAANLATAATGAAPISVAKAGGTDAKTVAELVKGRLALKDKPVLLRGQVMKVSLGIMGKNWLHLQDGSGNAADGSHDIVVTSKDSAAVGDVVTAQGLVRTDVNLGSGYAYAVLIEDAVLRK
jgi:hypothetical protein